MTNTCAKAVTDLTGLTTWLIRPDSNSLGMPGERSQTPLLLLPHIMLEKEFIFYFTHVPLSFAIFLSPPFQDASYLLRGLDY